MISSHDGELELLVYWTGTVSVVSHTGLDIPCYYYQDSSECNQYFLLPTNFEGGKACLHMKIKILFFIFIKTVLTLSADHIV